MGRPDCLAIVDCQRIWQSSRVFKWIDMFVSRVSSAFTVWGAEYCRFSPFFFYNLPKFNLYGIFLVYWYWCFVLCIFSRLEPGAALCILHNVHSSLWEPGSQDLRGQSSVRRANVHLYFNCLQTRLNRSERCLRASHLVCATR